MSKNINEILDEEFNNMLKEKHIKETINTLNTLLIPEYFVAVKNLMKASFREGAIRIFGRMSRDINKIEETK